jgi:uncharacterized protein YidB (DUF937 family)
MGLLDVLRGMQNGPRGQPQPGTGGGSGGMSPITMALLALLAYKALKGRGGLGGMLGTGQASGEPGRPAPTGGGGLADILGGLFGGRPSAAPATTAPGGAWPGGLGGLLGGAAAGSLVSEGLSNLIKGFQESGHGRTAQSWVAKGPNDDIAPGDLEQALGSDTLDALSQQTGMRRQELLSELSQQLPDLVDQLTPDGRLPTHEEAMRMA